MKTSNKNLFILFGILLLALVVVQFTRQKGRSKSLRSELISIDTSRVTGVTILSPRGEVELIKTLQGWVAKSGDINKPTRENAVEAMLDHLNTIKPGRLTARKEEKWRDYAVDSTGTRVRVYDQGEVLTDIVLGRFGTEGQRSFHTFVRLYDEENVYVANNFMKMNVYEDVNDYRDNYVLRLRKDTLVSVSFHYLDSAFTLVKDGAWYVDNQPADSASVAKYIQDLSFVSSKSFYEQSVEGYPIYVVTFSYSNRPNVIIEGYAIEGAMVIKSSENDVELFQDTNVADKIFKRKDVFVGTP